jgi:hypothetical protein
MFGTTDWGTLEPEIINYGQGIKESAIVHPSDMVAIGEKEHTAGDFYMDLLEGLAQSGGNDFSGIAEQGRHNNNGNTSSQKEGAGGTGGSNYAMSDGSARFIKFPLSVDPLSLWANSDADRVLYAIIY